MYKLIFENSHGVEREVTQGTEKECMDGILEFCHNATYAIPYMRSWVEQDRVKIDVGSHTEFFYIEKIKEEESFGF